ncbi:MAG: Hsp20/alpha crystallin family protein [Fulvivirga sp.]|nr:Hsp20/alpha crystallin family protein [Fulvivirga sp.]
MLYGLGSRNKRSTLNPGFWRDFTGRDALSDFHTSEEAYEPPVNVAENDEEFIIDLATPGLCKQDFSINIDNDVLTIKGEKETKDANYSRQEFSYGRFEKSFVIPDNVKSDKISASCNDGILTIHIPKAETKSNFKKSIEIK